MSTSSRLLHSVSEEPLGNSKRFTFVAAVLAAVALLQATNRAGAQTASERLTSRPRLPAPTVKLLAVGDEIQTKSGERRRVRLPDGSVLFVNVGTRAALEAPRRLRVTAGEVYVETTARQRELDAPFVVRTPNREVSGQGTHFAVRVAKEDTAVTVTRGQARVSGLKRPLTAGQQLARAGAAPTPAARATHLLDWTRDLVLAAESPLVPASKHAGGALLARDPNGQEASITLRKFHVDVHIEDGFARTTIDQTYFNNSPWQLEGTFYFPLPPDASLSRLAMYVEGENQLCQLMEGGIAEAGHARQVYETIRYANRDPALLEWLDGSTFKMRVFPLEGRKEKRLLLSYTQRLSTLYDQTAYRFPAGHNLQTVDAWSFRARVQGGAGLAWDSPSHTLTAAKDNGDLVLEGAAQQARVDRDVVLRLHDTRQAAAEGAARFATAEQEQGRYLMLRYRPTLTTEARPQRRDWLFLCETSGDREPLLARVQIDLIRHLLSKADPDDTFNVLAAGTRTRAFAKGPQRLTPENVAAALAFLEGAHLVGALNLGRALNEAAELLKGSANPCLVHVGSGIAAMGERRQDVLVARIPVAAQYVGIGVGRRWNRALMKAAAEGRDGLFAQVNPDEPVAWRAFELSATLNTPRLQDVTVTDPATGKALLCYTTAVAQGEELCAVMRAGQGESLPKQVVVGGRLGGKALEQVLAVRDAAPRADYLPREWARLEIERLLAADAVKNRGRIVELSKAMYVMTPFTSLLVLENDDLYTQYKVDRGRKDHWAPYPTPAKIPVVYEPDPSQPDPKLLKAGVKLPAKQVMSTIVRRQRASFLTFERGGNSPARSLLDSKSSAVNYFRGVVPDQSTLALPSPLTEGRNEFGLPVLSKGSYVDRQFANTGREQLLRQLQEEEEENERLDLKAGQFRSTDSRRMERHLAWEPAEPAKVGEIVIAGPTVARDRVLRRGRIVYAGTVLSEPPSPPKVPPLFRRGLTSVDGFVSELLSDSRRTAPLLYERPAFNDNARHFFDLLAYAPGMDTDDADVQAVLAAEALPHPANRPGKVDAAARALLDRARSTGWQALRVEEPGQTPYTIVFDGKGRYAYERILPLGVIERVVCDGKTLLHLYPQLGIGARRTVSRFHRAAFFDAVPQALPLAEDLARGADLKAIGERTIAVVPHGAEEAKTADGKPAPYARLHLLFDADGRLAERQVVRMPRAEVLYREVCAADGTVRLLDGKGKELLTRKGTLTPAKAPSLKPDTKAIVVLPLPYRTPEHVRRTLKIENKQPQDLRFADALHLLASAVGQNNASEAQNLFQRAFHSREQRQLGFYVLLAACGVNLDGQNVDVLAEHLDAPVAQYLALHSSPVLRKHAAQWAVASAQWGEGMFRHLAVSHALYQRWQSEKVLKGDKARVKADVQRALDYVRRQKGTAWGWALLCLMQDRAGKDQQLHAALAACCPLFEEVPGLRYAARYERGRCLWRAGQKEEARKQFTELYAATLKDGALPLLDAEFRQALLGVDADSWGNLLRGTAQKFVKDGQRPAVLALAWQCWQLNDAPLANHLLGVALERITDEKERLSMTLGGLQFLWQTGQLPRADQLLQGALKDAKWGQKAALWRFAVAIAEKRDLPAQALACLERALDLEYQAPPKVVDLQVVRRDYGKLLGHYQNLADAMVTLKVRPPRDFLGRAVRAADRWRALDRGSADACRAVARVLQRLGERDLGWDYLTTPIALSPTEAGPWAQLAQTLNHKGELELADRAYTAAYEAEPTNAQYLWDRAQNLRQAGRTVEAARLFRQLAEGQWQPRFQGLQAQARLQAP